MSKKSETAIDRIMRVVDKHFQTQRATAYAFGRAALIAAIERELNLVPASSGLAGFITLPEAARLLGVSRQGVWQMVKRGKLTAINIGSGHTDYRVPVAAVKKLAKERG